MAISPRDLHGHALTLGMADELSCRAAINRAYYGAFHAASQYHGSMAVPGMTPPQTSGVHATLYYRLEHPAVPNSDPAYWVSKQIGYKARELKRYREISDYQLLDTVAPKDVEYVLAASASTIDLSEKR